MIKMSDHMFSMPIVVLAIAWVVRIIHILDLGSLLRKRIQLRRSDGLHVFHDRMHSLEVQVWLKHSELVSSYSFRRKVRVQRGGEAGHGEGAHGERTTLRWMRWPAVRPRMRNCSTRNRIVQYSSWYIHVLNCAVYWWSGPDYDIRSWAWDNFCVVYSPAYFCPQKLSVKFLISHPRPNLTYPSLHKSTVYLLLIPTLK